MFLPDKGINYETMEMDRNVFESYLETLNSVANYDLHGAVNILSAELISASDRAGKIFICGNGGSGANALHIENDWSIGIAKSSKHSFRIETIGANFAVFSAIANDFEYSEVFSRQISLKSNSGDLLIVLSGSGNSINVVNAVRKAKEIGVRTCGIVGFDGGIVRNLLDVCIHIPINDMQIVEDLQLVLGHLVLRNFQSSRLS
jgi:D-sedoheptulose 7-phosphate isomerase